MPDGRFISKSISLSGQLKNVSLEADYLFGRMIPHLDRDARMDGDPDVVKATACPLRAEMTPELIRTALAELDAVGLIEWYEVDGQMVCHFPAFGVHQRGMKYEREAPSRLPSRETQGAKPVRRHAAPMRSGSGPTPDQVRTNSGSMADQVRLSEVKLSEVKGSKDSAPDDGAGWPKTWAHDSSSLLFEHGVVIDAAMLGKHAKPVKDSMPWAEWLRVLVRMAKADAFQYGVPAALRRLKEFRDGAQPDPNRELTFDEVVGL
jgi:hypothetical protein